MTFSPSMAARVTVFAALVCAAPAAAASPEDQALALLRAASAQSAIIVFCAKHHAIDGTTALRISQTSRDVAAKVLGAERAEAAFKDELARRYAEVEAAGEVRWCEDQRADFAADGIGIFKD